MSNKEMTKIIPPYTRVDERILSSRIPTEMIFDDETVDKIQQILVSKARQIIGIPPRNLLRLPQRDQEKVVQRFVRSLVVPLHNIPHFLYNKIDFEVQPVGNHQSLFGTGYQHTYWTIITVIVNETISPETVVEAMQDNFEKELSRLRSVIRHEFAHKLDMERIHLNPLHRIQSRRFQKAVTAAPGHSEYYGKPTEIIAHANHTVELMAQGHDKGWKEVLANFVLTDTSPGRKNTKKYIKTVVKLTKEYNIPFTKRFLLRRELTTLSNKMHMRLGDLVGKDEIQQRNTLSQIGLNSGTDLQRQSSVRLHTKQ